MEQEFRKQDITTDFIRSLLKKEEYLLPAEEYAKAHHIPILMPESATILKQLVMLSKPKRVLEIGMGIGYSGSIILHACKDAQLDTIEWNESSIDFAKAFFAQNDFLLRVNIFRGDESEIIPYLKLNYDFIFLDGAKTRYVSHLPHLKSRLNSGGILLADNILFAGMVSGERESGSKQSIADALRQFLHNLTADNDFITSILSGGDGMSLSIKR